MKRASKKKAQPKNTPANVDTTPELEALWLVLKPAQFSAHSQAAQALAELAGIPGAIITWLRTPPTEAVEERELLLVLPKKAAVSNAQGWDAARRLRQAKEVVDAEPLFRTSGLEADPSVLAPHERKLTAKSGGSDKLLKCAENNSIWQLEEINAPEAWILLPPPGGQRGGKGIVIGHPDTGYTKHFEIWPKDGTSARVKPGLGYNFEEGRPDPLDLMTGKSPGHGTATASVIMSSAGGEKRMFVTGAAPEADLVPFRVKDSVIHFSFKNLIQAIYRAVDTAGVHVISMSLGGPVKARALESALDYAISKGVIVIAAAGNHYPWTIYPAGYRNVIALAATDCESKPWSGSTNGEQVDLCAPGDSVWRAHAFLKNKALTFDVAPSSGSSYATALTAGAAAAWLAFWGREFLIKRYGPARIQEVFSSLLKNNGCNVPSNWNSARYGKGILDMRKLLATPLPPALKAAKTKQTKAAKAAQPDIAHYFPDIKATRVDTEIAKLVGVKRAPKAKGAAGGLDLEELAFQVATNAQLRHALHKRMSGPVAKAANSQPDRVEIASQLSDASAALTARLIGN